MNRRTRRRTQDFGLATLAVSALITYPAVIGAVGSGFKTEPAPLVIVFVLVWHFLHLVANIAWIGFARGRWWAWLTAWTLSIPAGMVPGYLAFRALALVLPSPVAEAIANPHGLGSILGQLLLYGLVGAGMYQTATRLILGRSPTGRTPRGCCARCGYARSGLARCPECGGRDLNQ